MQARGRCSAGCFRPAAHKAHISFSPRFDLGQMACSAILLWLTGLVHNFCEITLKGINSLCEDTIDI